MIKQGLIARALAGLPEVVHRPHDSPAKEVMPNAVGKNSRGQRVGRVRNPIRKLQASTAGGIDLQVGEIKYLRKTAGNYLAECSYVSADMNLGVSGFTLACPHCQRPRLLF